MIREEPGGHGTTLLVGVSNPATADKLVRLAATLARGRPVEILLTHVVTVASQISLTTGGSSAEVMRARDFLQGVCAGARAEGTTARALVEVARSVEDGLLAAAESHEAAMILVGYSDETKGRGDRVVKEERFDRTMHRLARKAKAAVLVAKFRTGRQGSVLVPVAEGAPLGLTGLLCRSLAQEGSEFTFLHVAGPEESEVELRGRLIAQLREAGLADRGTLRIVASTDPVAGIVEEADAHDLVILGPSGRPGLLQRVFSGRTQRIAESVSASVILAWSRDAGADGAG